MQKRLVGAMMMMDMCMEMAMCTTSHALLLNL